MRRMHVLHTGMLHYHDRHQPVDYKPRRTSIRLCPGVVSLSDGRFALQTTRRVLLVKTNLSVLIP